MPWQLEWDELEALSDASDSAVSLLNSLLRFSPLDRPTAAEALRHEWLRPLHTAADLCGGELPACPFPFEDCELNLDHFLLAALDAVHDTEADYPLRLPEMLRVAIMHDS